MTVAGSWQRLSDVYYTLEQCYDTMAWSVESDLPGCYRMASSPEAVAVASKYGTYVSVIDVYGHSGVKLTSVVYNSTPSSHVVAFSLHHDHLVVVLSSGRWRYYTDFHGHFNEYDLVNSRTTLTSDYIISETNESEAYITNLENGSHEPVVGVSNAAVWHDWLVVTMAAGITVVPLPTTPTNMGDLRSYWLRFPTRNLVSFTGHEHSIYAAVGKSVARIDVNIADNSYDVVDFGVTEGPYTEIAVSPNGNLVALYSRQQATVSVVNHSFSQVLLQYTVAGDHASVSQMAWVGNDALALAMRDEVRVVGPSQSHLSFFYDTVDDDFDLTNLLNDPTSADVAPVAPIVPRLATTGDGAYVYTSAQLQFLSRVGQPMLDLFEVGSSHPGAILLDGLEKRAVHPSKADINIQLLKSDPGALVKAIRVCLEAALASFNVGLQKKLLRAATFGKMYLDLDDKFDSDEYCDVVNTLKVLNQLRASDVGVFVTYLQAQQDWLQVVKSLLLRDKYGVALRASELIPHLKSYRSMIYVYWCCAKIMGSPTKSDDELYQAIKSRLAEVSTNVDVAAIIDTAHNEGRPQLCKQVIALEPLMSRRISAYLRYDETEHALVVALASGQVDMAQLVLVHLQETLAPSRFYKVLGQTESSQTVEPPKILAKVSGELIGNFWVNTVAKDNSGDLEQYYQQHDDFKQLAKLRYQARTKDYDGTKSALRQLQQTSRHSKAVFQRQIDLLDCKSHLCSVFNTNEFLDNPDETLVDVLVRLIKMNQLKQAQKVVKQFKMATEKFHHLVLRTYTDTKQWDHLYQFAQGDKSPIGWKPYIDAGLANQAPSSHISEYIRRWQGRPEEKIEMYLRNRDVSGAADTAFRAKDVAKLREMLSEYQLDEHQQLIQVYLQKLNA
ncbi:hypothetical protein DIURU_003259 [Diutina rugosa]|uniref:Probable vacuolar protein sorting-associated protein 16 homolog n=1 Tax=Diutina rugosa TaxID=5481 RepID=A0A642UTF3_DIURU|nr:uncharacterized protein DIURU_003259 [Diutina rugosa]KAA8901407.1 hypothetical protein DIURU_003259 [Diutina rugosa]